MQRGAICRNSTIGRQPIARAPLRRMRRASQSQQPKPKASSQAAARQLPCSSQPAASKGNHWLRPSPAIEARTTDPVATARRSEGAQQALRRSLSQPPSGKTISMFIGVTSRGKVSAGPVQPQFKEIHFIYLEIFQLHESILVRKPKLKEMTRASSSSLSTTLLGFLLISRFLDYSSFFSLCAMLRLGW